jgi:hypothetical protein
MKEIALITYIEQFLWNAAHTVTPQLVLSSDFDAEELHFLLEGGLKKALCQSPVGIPCVVRLALPVCHISHAFSRHLWTEIMHLISHSDCPTFHQFFSSLDQRFFPLDPQICSSPTVRNTLELLFERCAKQTLTESEETLLQAFFGAGCTRSELRKVGLYDHWTLGDHFDSLLVFLSYLTQQYPANPKDRCYENRRFVLLIHDIDHITSSSTLDVARLTNFLQLALSQTDGLTIWLNTAYSDYALLHHINQALGYRLTTQFTTTFPPLTST